MNLVRFDVFDSVKRIYLGLPLPADVDTTPRFRLLMSQFVRDCVRQRDPIVLVNAAAAIRLAHAGYVRHSQGAANTLARANVLPRHQNRHVMVIRVRVVAGI